MGMLIPIAKESLPHCAVCNRPVEELRCWYDNASMRNVYEARCHGERERCIITDQQLAECDGLSFGVAFARETLLPQHTIELLGR